MKKSDKKKFAKKIATISQEAIQYFEVQKKSHVGTGIKSPARRVRPQKVSDCIYAAKRVKKEGDTLEFLENILRYFDVIL